MNTKAKAKAAEEITKETNITITNLKENDEKISLILKELNNDPNLLKEFRAFGSKEAKKQQRKDIEEECKEILNDSLRKEYKEAQEVANKVYRKAWTLACKNLELKESEYPCKS